MTQNAAIVQIGNYNYLNGQRRMVDSVCYKAVAVFPAQVDPNDKNSFDVYVSLYAKNNPDLTILASVFSTKSRC
jgi:hypothetical protein